MRFSFLFLLCPGESSQEFMNLIVVQPRMRFNVLIYDESLKRSQKDL